MESKITHRVPGHSCSLEEAVKLLPGYGTARNMEVERLAGGQTNCVYKVDLDGRSHVLRLSGPNVGLLGIDRSFERDVAQAAARIGVSPRLLTADLRKGAFLFEFVAGEHPTFEQMHEPAIMRRVVGVLKRVHSIRLRRRRFCPFQKAVEWSQAALCRGAEIPPEFPDLHDRLQQLQKRLRDLPAQRPALCHNDVVRGNLILAGETIRLIDWEYAGLGDPLFDLAAICMNNRYSSEEERFLLSEYLGREDQSALLRLQILKLAFDFHLWVWYFAQMDPATAPETALARGAQHHDTRLLRNLEEL